MGDLDRVRFGSKIVDRRTSEMLAEAERLAQAQDPSIDDFHLTQGCWHTGVAASAGTHSGPGAFDMYTASYTPEQKEIIGMALREVGFASWRRRAIPGKWKEHWHGIAMDTEGLPPVAARQVKSYLNGRDGLVGNREDPDPRPKDINTWEEYKQEKAAAGGQTEPADLEIQPAPMADPYAIDSGLPLDRDTDSDGLTDAFEKLARTDIRSGDSDSDGLSDAYEAVQSHTDPLSSDTDADGQGDAAELAFGSDAGRLPGIAGVVGTGVFAENIRDGVKDADADGLSDHTEKLVGLDAGKADSDADGLSDSVEAALGTDPLLADTDHDGLTDELEVEYGSDPLGTFIDSAGRTVKTAPWTLEAAYARLTAQQQQAGQPEDTAAATGATAAMAGGDPYAIDSGQPLGQSAPLPGAEPVDVDTDRDGLTDAFEKLAGTKVAVGDSDADGLSDGYEALRSRTDPLASDTDSDRLTDAQEVATGGDAGTIPGVAGVVGVGALAENVRDGVNDADSDGLSDRVEKLVGTDAKKADTDSDKLSDAMEVALGTNPLLADTDRDGISDAIEVQYGMDPLAPGSAMASSVPGAGVAGPGTAQPVPVGESADGGGAFDPN
jgi:hypothetical protein